MSFTSLPLPLCYIHSGDASTEDNLMLSWINVHSAELDSCETYHGVHSQIIMSMPERENILQH